MRFKTIENKSSLPKHGDNIAITVTPGRDNLFIYGQVVRIDRNGILFAVVRDEEVLVVECDSGLKWSY
jgi:hypothetical protein